MLNTEKPASVRGLSAEGIRKYFSGVPALAGVSVSVAPGEIVGLVGHNGAGKSTLLKVLSGAHQSEYGSLRVDGKPVSFSSPADALKNGVATVYQELSLLQNLTVTQNVWLGRELRDWRGLQKRRMRLEAQKLLEKFSINVDLDAPVGNYPVATRQILEIAIATSKNAKYLLLDEPTTALEGEQIDNLLDYIKGVAKNDNIGVLIVNHKLDELYRICDRIVALVDGEVRIDADASSVSHEKVVEAIAGEDAISAVQQEKKRQDETISTEKIPDKHHCENPALSITDLSSTELANVSLEVFPGEVLGIYGLIGSGRTELLRALIGLDRIHSGEIRVFGKMYSPHSPKQAMRSGIVYVTEERKHDGIVPQMSGVVNSALPVLSRFSRFGWLSLNRMEREISNILDSLHIRGNSKGNVESLSGGNQQKVLLGRAIAQQPKILMLDEPTKGVDIGAKSEIHRIFKRMAHEDGVAVIVVSSEEEEIMEVSDKICVFAQGANVSKPRPASDYNVTRLRKEAWSK